MSRPQSKLPDAFNAACADMPPARRNAENPEYGSTYADHTSVHEAVTPSLKKHGIGFSQTVRETNGTYWAVTVFRLGSERLEFANVICSDPKQGPHRFESASTQAHRICLARACGLAIGVDDDGNRAAGKGRAQATRQPADQNPKASAIATELMRKGKAIDNAPDLRDFLAANPVLNDDHQALKSVKQMLERHLRELEKKAFAA